VAPLTVATPNMLTIHPLSAIEPYIGRAYCPDAFDCADLVQLVLREVFGVHLHLPGKRLGMAGRMLTLRLMQDDLLQPTDSPTGGDVAVYRGADGWHVGVCVDAPTGLHVLHNSKAQGSVALWHPSAFVQIGQTLQGYFKCK